MGIKNLESGRYGLLTQGVGISDEILRDLVKRAQIQVMDPGEQKKKADELYEKLKETWEKHKAREALRS